MLRFATRLLQLTAFAGALIGCSSFGICGHILDTCVDHEHVEEHDHGSTHCEHSRHADHDHSQHDGHRYYLAVHSGTAVDSGAASRSNSGNPVAIARLSSPPELSIHKASMGPPIVHSSRLGEPDRILLTGRRLE